jgi:hypothetical protein
MLATVNRLSPRGHGRSSGGDSVVFSRVVYLIFWNEKICVVLRLFAVRLMLSSQSARLPDRRLGSVGAYRCLRGIASRLIF